MSAEALICALLFSSLCVACPPRDKSRGSQGDPWEDFEQRSRCERNEVLVASHCNCEFQQRLFRDGQWSDWSGTFEFEECEVVAEDAERSLRERCKVDKVADVEDCECETQERQKDSEQGSEWTGTFTHESCDVSDMVSCVFESNIGGTDVPLKQCIGSDDREFMAKCAERAGASETPLRQGPCPSENRIAYCDFVEADGDTSGRVSVYASLDEDTMKLVSAGFASLCRGIQGKLTVEAN